MQIPFQRNHFFLLISLSGFGAIHNVALAQDAGALQRQFQQQIERSAPQVAIPEEKPVEKKRVDPNAQRIQIKDFRFQGNQLISSEELKKIVQSFTQHEITFSDLKDLTTTIQEAYGKKNRIAQANIPPQEIKDGVLLIEIREGKLGSVIVEPATPGDDLHVHEYTVRLYFSKAIDGTQYINTERISRVMTLINELPGVTAAGEFEPSSQTGETDFRVKLADGPRLGGQVAFSNYGSASTGSIQGIANVSLNNLTGIGDQLSLDAIQSWGSTYAQLGYSIPVGYDGWRVGAQTSYLNYQTLDSWSSTQTSGSASTVGIHATYPLVRVNGEGMNVKFNFENRNYSNDQNSLNISNYQINALSAGINGYFPDSARSVVNYNVTATLGNLAINNVAQSTQDASGPATSGTYAKFSFNVSRNQDLTWLPNTQWLLSFNGQLANTNLNSSEQIYMGGAYGVRAYPVAQGGGSQGAILSNELQYKLNQEWQLGTFFDVGLVQQFVNTYPNWQGLTNASNTYLLAAIGPTVKYAHDRWTVNAILAMRLGDNPLYNSSGQQLNTDNAYRQIQGWIRASYAF